MAMTNQTMNDGNHTDHQPSVKTRAPACPRTSTPNTFIASVIESPINPSRSVAFMLSSFQREDEPREWPAFASSYHRYSRSVGRRQPFDVVQALRNWCSPRD